MNNRAEKGRGRHTNESYSHPRIVLSRCYAQEHPPPLVEESSGSVEVLEIIIISFSPEEIHVADFKITPEMARRISVCFHVMLWSTFAIFEPFPRVFTFTDRFFVFRMRGEEFLGFWPERGHGLRGVIEIDDEAVGFVMVCHVAKDIVVDVTEEVDFGFYAPVVFYVLKGWVLVEEARIPTAHLVVGYQVAVLDLLFF